jgi:hypothetical protein
MAYTAYRMGFGQPGGKSRVPTIVVSALPDLVLVSVAGY